MIWMRWMLTILILGWMALPGMAQQQTAFDPQRHMRIAEVHSGMTGYGLSVFYGTKIERFEVEVVSVLKNFNPQGDVILIRCKGANLEHTGPIAGMSGSPIYLKDDSGKYRLVGAFAYGWQMMKDPLAGVQPIEYMMKLDTSTPTTSPTSASTSTPTQTNSRTVSPVRWSIGDIVWPAGTKPSQNAFPFSHWNIAPAPQLGGELTDAAQLHPLSTPLMTSGMPTSAMGQLESIFKSYGMVPLQSGGGSSANSSTTQPAVDLDPGSVLAVPLLTGDVDMTAIGTCTEVLGDRVYGFGHNFNNEGQVSWPMGSGRVNAVIASMMSSFKIGELSQIRGTLRADQMVGVAGVMGEAPPTVPIDLHLVYTDGSLDRNYHFNAAIHPKFTPLLAGAAISAAVSSARELPQYHTLDYDLKLDFEDGQTIEVHNTAVNSSANDVFADIGLPMMAAAENPFQRVMVKKISGTLTVTPEAREAVLLSVNLPKLKYQPGQMLKAYVTYRPFRAAEAILPVELELPRDLPEGTYQLVISDWQRFLQDEMSSKPFRFTAENIQQVFDVLHDYTSFRRDAVYLRLLRQPDGVAIGRVAMPHLPSSRRQILMDAGRSNTTPFVSSTVKVIPTPLVMSGAAEFQITIDQYAKVEVAGKPPKAEPAQPPPAKQEHKPAPKAEPPAVGGNEPVN
ncbi:MAG: hypothetical protein IT447_13570 [Phycisphaerales bacterium]|nr:hypothetical protein [Phycisphaerales bacterium]